MARATKSAGFLVPDIPLPIVNMCAIQKLESENDGQGLSADIQHLWAARLLHFSFALMTLVTGLVDAVSYLRLGHVFTANMTGNVVLLGFAVARAPGPSFSRSLSALTFALVGGIVAGRLHRRMSAAPTRKWLWTALGLETLLLLMATCLCALAFDNGQLSTRGVYGVIMLTSLAMSIRNVTVRRLGIADITTTVLTSTIASLAAESSLAGGKNPRWGRRVTAILAMLAGAAAGAFLARYSLALVLALATAISGITMSIQLFRKDTEQERSAYQPISPGMPN